MRKIVTLIISLAMMIGLVGCANTRKQEALREYLDVYVPELAAMEEELLASYESETGSNYTSDYDTYMEFTTYTINLARELNDASVEIASYIMDSEVLEVHRIYMNYSNKFLSAVNIMISALENQDVYELDEANARLNEANNFALDYNIELNKLMEKYKVYAR